MIFLMRRVPMHFTYTQCLSFILNLKKLKSTDVQRNMLFIAFPLCLIIFSFLSDAIIYPTNTQCYINHVEIDLFCNAYVMKNKHLVTSRTIRCKQTIWYKKIKYRIRIKIWSYLTKFEFSFYWIYDLVISHSSFIHFANFVPVWSPLPSTSFCLMLPLQPQPLSFQSPY